MHRKGVLLIAAVLSILLLGCGGNSSHSGQTVPAIRFVQETPYSNVSPTFPQPSYSVPFANSVTSGNLIVVAIAGFYAPGLSVSVTDSAGNSYTEAVQQSTANPDSVLLYYAANVRGGSNLTVTVMVSYSPYRFAMVVLEYSGVNARDVTAASAGPGSPGVDFSSGLATTSSANELVVGAALEDAPGYPSAGAGFSTRFASSGFCVEDKIVPAAGPVAAVLSPSTGASWAAVMATFRISSSI